MSRPLLGCLYWLVALLFAIACMVPMGILAYGILLNLLGLS